MSKEIKAWKCEECGKAYMYKQGADDCCKVTILENSHCEICDAEIAKYRTICDDCLSKRRYKDGTKIKYSEYDLKWLFDGNTDEYFSDIDALIDYYIARNLELPIWCYGCNEITFTVDIDGALENASEEMYEDFEYGNDAVDIEGLIEFMEKWNKKQTASSYECDYKKIILLNE